MTIVEIAPLDNGGHRNQTTNGATPEGFPVPEGWAVLPGEVGTPETLENFPFGDITIKTFEDVPTVTNWTPLPVPEPEPAPEPEPSQLDRVEAQATYTAMMTDTLLEV